MIKLKTIPLFNMEVVFLMTDNWWPLLPEKKKKGYKHLRITPKAV